MAVALRNPYDLRELPQGAETAVPDDPTVVIRRAMAPDMLRVVEFVKGLSSLSAAGECTMCFQGHPISCYIATRDDKILGYACYNATAPDFFGPTAVLAEERGKGIGRALLPLWATKAQFSTRPNWASCSYAFLVSTFS